MKFHYLKNIPNKEKSFERLITLSSIKSSTWLYNQERLGYSWNLIILRNIKLLKTLFTTNRSCYFHFEILFFSFIVNKYWSWIVIQHQDRDKYIVECYYCKSIMILSWHKHLKLHEMAFIVEKSFFINIIHT